MATDSSRLCLGIDLGTTSVKLSLLEVENGRAVFCTSEPARADIQTELGCNEAEQDVQKILDTVKICLDRVTTAHRQAVSCIGISGQMHGVMLWNGDYHEDIADGNIVAKETSPFYTWQDQRVEADFLSGLPVPDSHQHLAKGFGCVTLYWLTKHKPLMLSSLGFNCAGNIVDFLVSSLCGLDRPTMSNQIAASWGYFNTETNSWNVDTLKNSNFPVHLLPVVQKAGSIAGHLKADWLEIKAGIPVLVGMGDLQCAIRSAVKQPHDAVLNISTSCQLAIPLNVKTFSPPRTDIPGPVTYFPYFEDQYLAVAASLNGGNVLALFVETLKQWTHDLTGVTLTDEQLWEKLNKLGENASPSSDLTISPTIHGERHCPSLQGSVSGITESGLSLGAVYKSLCQGLVDNLTMMMPCSFVIENGVTRIITSGSVIELNNIVRKCIEQMYGTIIPVVAGYTAESALGAAMIARQYLVFQEKLKNK